MEEAVRCHPDCSHHSQGGWHRNLGPLLPRSTGRPVRLAGGIMERDLGGVQTPLQPTGAQAPSPKEIKPVLFLLLLLLRTSYGTSHLNNPDAPWNQTWLIINTETGVIANSSSLTRELRDIWFPDLYVDLCDLVGEAWDPSDQEPFPGYGCASPGQRKGTREQRFYVCPGHSRDRAQIKKCGGPESAYCAAWGCESTGYIWWEAPVKNDLITVGQGDRSMLGTGRCQLNGSWVDCGPCYDQERFPNHPWATPGGRCNSLIIRFTEEGKRADWTIGKTWGLRLYRSGRDPRLIFTIQRILSPVKTKEGPNMVLNPPQPKRIRPREPGTTIGSNHTTTESN
ncbi:hypothetical protein STEG23_028861 [Scotinomys teguina]